jgi:hypothetical protein
MATFNLFLNASQADSAITNAYRLFHPEGLTGVDLSLYGGNINHWGSINSTQINITGGIGEESFIDRLTGGIRVAGDCEFDSIINGVSIHGTSYIENLTGGLNINNGGINVVGSSVNNGSFRNVGPVSVTGPTNITGATRIVGATEFLGNYFQSGSFNVVSNNAEFRGNLDVTGALDINGPLQVRGVTTIIATGGLNISGPTNVVGNSRLEGTTNIVGELQLNGQPFFTQQLNQITETNYFITGGECLTLLTGVGGDIIQTSNTGLIPKNQGPSINGNPRGNYSVDLQLTRNSGTQVAGGSHSALIGGASNTASGAFSSVIGGSGNRAGRAGFGSAAILGGTLNTVGGLEAVVVGGFQNTVSGAASAVVGGAGNRIRATHSYSAILGGFSNQLSEGPSFQSNTAISCSIVGGSHNAIDAPYLRNATIIGGQYGRAFNQSERVLSNGSGDGVSNVYRIAQVGELVLSLQSDGSYANGVTPSINLGSGIWIPDNTLIAFKGIGAMNDTFVEFKGMVTNSSFQLSPSYTFGSSSNITGGVFGTGESIGSYINSNVWFLNEINPPSGSIGTIYLEMVYMPFADPYEDPYGDPYGGFAFNSDASLGTLFS